MRLILLSACFLLVTYLYACGGSDSPTATPGAQEVSPSVTSHPITDTPVGQKTGTPPVQGTPSVAVTAPGDTFTPPPVPAGGTPAAAPADQQAFSTSFTGQPVDFQTCLYRLTAGIVDCNSVLYAISPAMTGQDVTCTLWVVSGTPHALACQAAEPPGTTYYEIQQ